MSVKFFARCVLVYACMKCVTSKGRKENFANNGYPPHIVNRTIRNVLNPRPRTTDSDSDVHFIYMKLPWIGDNRSEAFEKLIIQATKPAYPACRPRVCFVSKPAFPSCLKDALPIHDKSNVIYFECRCGSRYIGKTIQRLEARIKQHIPAYVLEPSKKAKKKTKKQKKKESDQKDEDEEKEEEEERKAPDSAIGEHLVANVGCLNVYDRKQFTVLTVHVARTQCRLDTLEALLIKKFKVSRDTFHFP